MRARLCLAGSVATVAAAVVAALPAAAACGPPGISWKGRHYSSTSTVGKLGHGSRLYGGTFPGCDDHIVMVDGQRVNEPPPDQPAKLVRLRGISPAIAVGVVDDKRTAYLAPGFLLGLTSHPLHREVFGDMAGDERRSNRCTTERRRVIRTVPWQPTIGVGFTVGSPDSPVEVKVDGRTVVTGQERAGLPYIRKGDRVLVEGLVCRADYVHVLARRIRIIPR